MRPILRAIISGVVGFLSALLAAVSAMPGEPTLAQVPLSVWLFAAVAGLTSLYSPNGVTLTTAPQLRRAEDRGEPPPPGPFEAEPNPIPQPEPMRKGHTPT